MNLELAEKLTQLLVAQKQTVGFAESCTGGLASSTLTRVSGVSQVFLGSVIAYDNSVKEGILKVKQDLIERHGAVSEEVAQAMAQGAKEVLRTDWSVGMTGIAGPNGGTPEKPVGLVWFAGCGPSIEWSEKKVFSGDRHQIQNQAVQWVFQKLCELVAMPK